MLGGFIMDGIANIKVEWWTIKYSIKLKPNKKV